MKTLTYDHTHNLTLDIFFNTGTNTKNTCIYFLYGGRWSDGKKEDFRFVAYRFLKAGYHVAIADYRKFPQAKFPDFIHDAANGLAAVHEQFEPSTRFVVMGHSSGAQIGAMLSLNPSYTQKAGGNVDMIDRFIGISGPYKFIDHIDQHDDLPQIFGPREDYHKSQPILLAEDITHKPPPMLLIHGEKDTVTLPLNSTTLAKIVNEKHEGYGQAFILPDAKHVSTIGVFALPSWSTKSRMMMNAIDGFIAREF
ncbi:MAG: alpha/beta hydrolase [Proteobacteria bacterium]|nr:alpha/beta hydrolase [Pseudomonadota bacterium]